MDLVFDLLQQALDDSQNPASWHRLANVFLSIDDQEAKDQVMALLMEQPFGEPRTDYLRWTFLRDMTQRSEMAVLAARSLLKIAHFNADRMAAFVTYAWGHSVKHCIDQDAFVQALKALQIPHMVKLLGAAATQALPAGWKQRVPDRVQRVALLTPCLADGSHTPSVMTVQLARVLADTGISAHLFSCQEQIIADDWRFCGGNQTVLLPSFDPDYWRTALPPGQQLQSIDTHWSLNARWQKMFSALQAYDPDVVISCGLYCPAAMALYTLRPVLGLNVHALPIMSPVDVRLRSTEAEDPALESCWFPDFDVPTHHEHPYRLYPLADRRITRRSDLGIGDDAVVWISVGARLSEEIRSGWGTKMAKRLQEHTHAVWLLVGSANLPPCLSSVAPHQVRVLSHRSDVGDLLGLADVYVNPERMGGGFSVAEAMGAGLATLSLCGSDGGDKLGPFASLNLEEYFNALDLLTTDPQRRLALGQQLRERFDQRLNLEKSGPSLVKALHLAVEQAARRMSLGTLLP